MIKEDAAPPAWRPLVRVGLVLLIGGSLSFAWWINERKKIRQDAAFQLQSVGAKLTYDLSDRLNRVEHLLFGARGLYTVNGHLSRQAWETYWNSGDVAVIPGLQSLTYLRRVERSAVEEFAEEMRRELPDFQLKPNDGSGYLVVIVFRRSFPPEPDFAGVDRAGQPAWAATAEPSRRSGRTLLSPVVPSISAPSEPRMVLLLPLYQPGAPLATDAERWAAHHGWVTAGVRPAEFFAGAAKNLPRDLRLDLTDITDSAHPQLLYASTEAAAAGKDSSVGYTFEENFFGRRLQFHLAALPNSTLLSRDDLARDGLFGLLLITGLLGTIMWGSARMEQRARKIAADTTRELNERESVLRQAQRIAHLGTCIYDVTTKTFTASDESYRIVGLSPAQGSAAVEGFLSIVHPEDRHLAQSAFERMQRGEISPPHQLRLTTSSRGERVLAVQHEALDPGEGGGRRIIVIIQDITDRIAADRALADSHRRMENLMRALPGVIFQLTRSNEGRFSVTFISDGALELFGRSPTDLTQQPDALFRCVNEDGSGEFLRSLEMSAETLRLWHYEARTVRSDTGVRWVHFSAMPMRLPENNAIVWNGVAIDTTETKRAEQALRDSEQRLRMTQFAVDHVKDAVAFISPQGDRIYVNDETCRLTGHTREELLQTKIWSTFASFSLETYCQMWAYVKSRGTHVFEAELRTRRGELRSVEVSVSFIGFGGQEMVFAIARDISARKAAELSLRDSEERLRFTQFALDHARDIVSIMDREGRRLYVNDTFCQFTGHDREELFRTRVWDGIPSLNRERFQALWDDIKRCKTLTFEIELMTKAGELKPLEVNASYLNFSGREAVCTISRDLTARLAAEAEKKRMQQQLQETQKLESLGVLAGGIAHDFNNLLTGVLGNASLARDRLSEGSDLHEPLRQIERAAMRASELCQQMLAYAGKGRFIIEPVNLSALVEDTAKLLDLSVARRARLDLQLAPNLPSVLADATQIRQIVMNLVLNAAEAMTNGRGSITVVTGRIQIDRPLLASARVAADLPEGDGVFLQVTDTGSGMDRETLDRIFEPFFTTKFTGRGLGLAAVLGIVRSHHGALLVDSELGRGTTFKLVLAAHSLSAAPTPGTPPLFQPTKRNHGRILVVDDEESVRSVTRQALERTGFTVDTAPDGESAIAMIRAEPRAYLLILLDYTMPRLDGAQTLREIRRLNADARVMLMSGFPESEARERLGDHSLAGFIQKPFDISGLRRQIEDVLRGETVKPV